MDCPPFLIKGDRIAVVAPARKVNTGEIEPAIEILKNWGLQPVTGDNLWKEQDQFSGNDEARKADLQYALDAPEIKAVFCARGGYGSVRIIDELDFNKFKKNPKWIVGFSDITVLHSHIHKNTNICSLHAPMLINFSKISNSSIEQLKETLFGKLPDITTTSHQLNKKGRAQGQVCGGNLSVLYSLLGSQSDIDTDGKILFIEDLDEYLYHIDRMMIAMKRSGKFNRLAGLIVGGMTDMNDNVIPFGKSAEEIISEYFKETDIPVAFNFPAGHQESNFPLIFGKEAELTVAGEVSLRYI